MNIRVIDKTIKVLVIIFYISAMLYPGDGNTSSHTIKLIVPEVALLDIESEISNKVALTMSAPSEAGNSLTSNSDESIWLNVTSIVENDKSRNISVKINETISGVNLNLATDAYQGSGYGYWGTPSGELSLSTNDQVIVAGITSGESGNGIDNGFNLKYYAQTDDSNFENIISTDDKEITVTYTLTD